MELSDEQKAHIRAEEIFREAVRREPKPGSATNSLTTKIIKWFNQPLGIWFLSAVLVTGISEAHKSYQSRQAKVKSEIESQMATRRARLELIRKLDGEIAMRLNRVQGTCIGIREGQGRTLRHRSRRHAYGSAIPVITASGVGSYCYQHALQVRDRSAVHPSSRSCPTPASTTKPPANSAATIGQHDQTGKLSKNCPVRIGLSAYLIRLNVEKGEGGSGASLSRLLDPSVGKRQRHWPASITSYTCRLFPSAARRSAFPDQAAQG